MSLALGAAATVGVARRGTAQQATTTAAAATYRAPTLALVRPDTNGSVPADHPVVVFRFSAGEATDPLDISSLRVWVDGVDRSSLFQRNGSDAWGPLGAPATAATASASARDSAAGASSIAARPLAPGVHLVSAQLCSVRGVCGSLHVPVLVLPPDDAPATRAEVPMDAMAISSTPTTGTTAASVPDHRSLARRLLDAVAGGIKGLLSP